MVIVGSFALKGGGGLCCKPENELTLPNDQPATQIKNESKSESQDHFNEQSEVSHDISDNEKEVDKDKLAQRLAIEQLNLQPRS